MRPLRALAVGLAAVAVGVASAPDGGRADAAQRSACRATAAQTVYENALLLVYEARRRDGSPTLTACVRRTRKRILIGHQYTSVRRVIAARYLVFDEGGYGEGDYNNNTDQLLDLRTGRAVEVTTEDELVEGSSVPAAGALLSWTGRIGECASGVLAVRLMDGAPRTLDTGCGITGLAASARRFYWLDGTELRTLTLPEAAALPAPSPTPTPVAASAPDGRSAPRARSAASPIAPRRRTCERKRTRTILRRYELRVSRHRNGVVRGCYRAKGRHIALNRVLDGVAPTGDPTGFVNYLFANNYNSEPLLYRFPAGAQTAVVLFDVGLNRVLLSGLFAVAPREVVTDHATFFAATDGATLEVVGKSGRRTVDTGAIADLAWAGTTLYWTNAGAARSAAAVPAPGARR